MQFEPLQIAEIGIIVCLAGLAQSAVGFGYALLSIPLLLWIGMPLPGIIALVATCSMIQSLIGALKLGPAVPWRLSWAATGVRILSVVAGMLLLRELADLNIGTVKMVVGGILCVLVVLQMLWQPRPAERLHWGWAPAAFAASGFLAGICGMGGPPLVLWCMAHDWPTEKTRGFLFGTFATAIPFQLALLGIMFGGEALRGMGLGIALFPLVYVGTHIGISIGNRISRTTLRTIAYLILLGIGISAVAPALWRMLP